MNPTAIPVAMLYVNGIDTTTKKEGTAISNLVQSIFPNEETIKIPTTTSAGVVTADVTTSNNGKKNKESKKNPAVTIAAKPERAPAATPADDSTKEVVVDVPKIEPTIEAIESANNALPALGNLLSFINPAWFATATNVPALSKKSTNRNVKITTSMLCV